MIASGALTPPVPFVPGDLLEAHYPTLGRVRLQAIPGVMGQAGE